MEPEHALADHMHPAVGTGPPTLVVGAACAIGATIPRAEIERGHVVAECVPPDVDDLARVARHFDAPVTRSRDGPGRAEILEPPGDKGQHLVPAAGWLDPQLAGADQVMQLPGVTGEPEEPVLLGYLLDRYAVVRAVTIGQFGARVELLAADAVQA